MAILPVRNLDVLSFAMVKSAAWLSHAAAIGITPARAAEVAAALEAAQADYDAAYAAEQELRTANSRARGSMDGLRAILGRTMNTIKAFAENQPTEQAREAVYLTSLVPAPRHASKRPAPGAPFNLAARLNNDGSLTLTWSCDNPRGAGGTVYTVMRADEDAAGRFAFVGAVGRKTFTDLTLPKGAAVVRYTVTARRGETVGANSQVLLVNFGVRRAAGRAAA